MASKDTSSCFALSTVKYSLKPGLIGLSDGNVGDWTVGSKEAMSQVFLMPCRDGLTDCLFHRKKVAKQTATPIDAYYSISQSKVRKNRTAY